MCFTQSSCPSEGSSVSKKSLEPWVIQGCHLTSLGCTSSPSAFSSFQFVVSWGQEAWEVDGLLLTLGDPMDCSLPGSSVCGILQARRLEWVVSLSFRGSSQPRVKPTSLMSPALPGRLLTTGATWEAHCRCLHSRFHRFLGRGLRVGRILVPWASTEAESLKSEHTR